MSRAGGGRFPSTPHPLHLKYFRFQGSHVGSREPVSLGRGHFLRGRVLPRPPCRKSKKGHGRSKNRHGEGEARSPRGQSEAKEGQAKAERTQGGRPTGGGGIGGRPYPCASGDALSDATISRRFWRSLGKGTGAFWARRRPGWERCRGRVGTPPGKRRSRRPVGPLRAAGASGARRRARRRGARTGEPSSGSWGAPSSRPGRRWRPGGLGPRWRWTPGTRPPGNPGTTCRLSDRRRGRAGRTAAAPRRGDGCAAP